MILAIDPGKYKCGLALLNEDGRIVAKKVAASKEISGEVERLIAGQTVATIVIGDSKFGKDVEKELSGLPARANLIFISEKDSTRLAREQYWRENPPAGLMKLIPTSLRFPPVPVDDLAAVILAERYLNS
ncbi:MAG: hypothetical protein PHH14_05150 [Candidatus Margulisbacteria bacterium]|nr:hypothetical protein [Candidatus Margulisiibacteriota bacterium]